MDDIWNIENSLCVYCHLDELLWTLEVAIYRIPISFKILNEDQKD